MPLGTSFSDLVNSFFDMLWAAVTSLFAKLKALVVKLLPIIIVLVVIWAAPYAVPYLTTIGAPTWLVSSVAWVGTYSATIAAAASWVAGATATFGAWAWTSFAAAGFWTEMAIIVGACALLAPEETQAFLTDLGVFVTDLVKFAAEVLTSVIPWWLWAIGGTALYFWLAGDDEDKSKLQYQGGVR